MIRSAHTAVLLGLSLIATTTIAAPVPAILKPGHREVPLDPARSVHQEEIRGAPFILTALVLPEPYAQATCGNCTSKQEPGVPENWFMQLDEAGRTIYLKPTRLPDAANPLPAFRTTIHITLVSGYRIAINLGLADIAGTTPPDSEVSFLLPQGATLGGRVAEELAKHEAGFAERLDRESKQRLLESLLGELRCDAPSSRPYVNDKLYLRLRQACTVDGPSNVYWVVFEVRNRGATPVALDQAVLYDAAAGPDATEGNFRFVQSSLRFDERSLGIALATLPPDAPRPASWKLAVTERGGKERQLVVSELTF